MDVFYGGTLGECEGADIGDGGVIMIVTHNGGDAWLGDWIRWDDKNLAQIILNIFRVVLDGGAYLQCPLDDFLDDFQSVTIRCS